VARPDAGVSLAVVVDRSRLVAGLNAGAASFPSPLRSPPFCVPLETELREGGGGLAALYRKRVGGGQDCVRMLLTPAMGGVKALGLLNVGKQGCRQQA